VSNIVHIYRSGSFVEENPDITTIVDVDSSIDSGLVQEFKEFKELLESIFVDYELNFEYKFLCSIKPPMDGYFETFKSELTLLIGKPDKCFKNIDPDAAHFFFDVVKYDTRWRFKNMHTLESVSLDNLDLYPDVDSYKFERLVNWIRYQINSR